MIQNDTNIHISEIIHKNFHVLNMNLIIMFIRPSIRLNYKKTGLILIIFLLYY